MQIQWLLKKFEALTPYQVYAILQLRNEVFVVEQACVFQDADDKDQHCYHLMGFDDNKLVAYSRIVPLFFLGDLGGNYGTGKTFIKDVNLPLTKISKGFYAAVYPSEFIGFRAAINHGKLEGYDHMVEDKGGAEYYRKKRNLQFQSSVLEAYIAAEIYPTVFMEQYDGLAGKLRPYGIVGFGAFKFNPKGEYIDASGRSTWVPLKPLHLEGQGMDEYPNRKEYKLVSTEIPMGFGAKYYIKDNMYIGMEVLHRKTFTDYVDDVSTDYIDGNLFDQYLSSADAQMAKQLFYRENRI